MHVHKAAGALEAIMVFKIGILGFWLCYILVHVLENQDLRLGVGSVHVATDVLHAKHLLFSLVTLDYYQVLFTLSLVSVDVVMPVQSSFPHGDTVIL